MKVFIVIAFSIFVAGNAYLYIRGWQALEILGRFRILYGIVFWLIVLLFIAINLLRIPGSDRLDRLHTIGSSWIAVMLYAALFLAALDLFRFVGWVCAIRPTFIYAHYPVAKLVLFGMVAMAISVNFAFGSRNARYPKVTRLDISVAKQAGEMKELRIAMVSDIHLGHTAGQKFLHRVVDRINELAPDVILLAGDTFDGDPEPVFRKDMGVAFDRLKSRYGVYAVTGNHEHIGERYMKGAAEKALDYLSAHGITGLVDTGVLVNNSFYIVGRNDYSKARKSLDSLLAPISGNLPVILMDHQPYHLEKVQQAGVDLQLSGHTHHGQMWPISLITRKLYELDWGYLQKGTSHFYVSCGVGTWGPALRTGSHSEIVFIRMTFE
jgi:predicted MPP superfamily phosphohydrolase